MHSPKSSISQLVAWCSPLNVCMYKMYTPPFMDHLCTPYTDHKNTQEHTRTHKNTQEHTRTHKNTQEHTRTTYQNGQGIAHLHHSFTKAFAFALRGNLLLIYNGIAYMYIIRANTGFVRGKQTKYKPRRTDKTKNGMYYTYANPAYKSATQHTHA